MTDKQTPPGASWRGSGSSAGSGSIVPSGLFVDGPRPGVAWVAGLPADWTNTTQRLILLLLACDAFVDVSAPGEDALMAWCGLRSRSAFYEAVKALAEPVEGVRPALIERSSQIRKRTSYRLLMSVRPDVYVRPDAYGDVSGDASGLTDPPFPFPTSTHLGNSGTDRAREGSDDDGAEDVHTVDTLHGCAAKVIPEVSPQDRTGCAEAASERPRTDTTLSDTLHSVEAPHPLRSRHEIRREAVGE